MEADDLVGAQGRVGDLGDGERGGVRGEDRVRGGGGVELGEDVLLDLDLLGHGLDHEIDVSEAAVGGRSVDAADDLVHLRLGLLVAEPAFLDEFSHLPLCDRTRLGEARVHERVVDVLEHHRDAGDGDRLRDLPAHRPCADDRGLEYEHTLRLLWLATDPRSASGSVAVAARRGARGKRAGNARGAPFGRRAGSLGSEGSRCAGALHDRFGGQHSRSRFARRRRSPSRRAHTR